MFLLKISELHFMLILDPSGALPHAAQILAHLAPLAVFDLLCISEISVDLGEQYRCYNCLALVFNCLHSLSVDLVNKPKG